MKKLIIAALLVVGMTSFAQERDKMERRQHGNDMEKFTPEQRNELMMKKMTLELDLSAKQQAQMTSIIAEKSAKRQEMMKARKENTKNILSAEQYEKWDAMKAKHEKRRSHRMHERRSDKMNPKKEMQK